MRLTSAYKLFTKHTDGSISSLFINRKQRLPIGVWLDAEEYPTKGFKVRRGWHALPAPIAPHLSTRNRKWYKVLLRYVYIEKRPASQGSDWYIAKRMKIVEEVEAPIGD